MFLEPTPIKKVKKIVNRRKKILKIEKKKYKTKKFN